MAKDKELVFSSELEERREKRRKAFILIGILLAVVIIAAAAVFFVRANRAEVFTGGEDTEYPYSWKERKGVVTIEIDHSADPARTWTAVNTDGRRISIEQPEKQPKDKSRFDISFAEAGRYNLVFALTAGDNEAAGVIEMLAEVTESEEGVLSAQILTSSLRKRQVSAQGGEGSFYPYTYSVDSDGFLVLRIAGAAAAGDWDCVSDNENVAVFAGLFYEDEDLIVYLMPGTEPGICGVKIWRTEAGVSLELGMELTAEGELLVNSEKLTGGDIALPQPPEDSEEPEESEWPTEPDWPEEADWTEAPEDIEDNTEDEEN